VDEIVGHLHPLHGRGERPLVQHIARRNLGGWCHARAEKCRAARQTADVVPGLLQGLQQSPTHIAGRPREEDQRLVTHHGRGLRHAYAFP
jgi:hypothetical protein